MCGIIAVLLADPSAAVNQEVTSRFRMRLSRGQQIIWIVTVFIR